MRTQYLPNILIKSTLFALLKSLSFPPSRTHTSGAEQWRGLFWQLSLGTALQIPGTWVQSSSAVMEHCEWREGRCIESSTTWWMHVSSVRYFLSAVCICSFWIKLNTRQVEYKKKWPWSPLMLQINSGRFSQHWVMVVWKGSILGRARVILQPAKWRHTAILWGEKKRNLKWMKKKMRHHVAGLRAITKSPSFSWPSVPVCSASARCKQYGIVYCLAVNCPQGSRYEWTCK